MSRSIYRWPSWFSSGWWCCTAPKMLSVTEKRNEESLAIGVIAAVSVSVYIGKCWSSIEEENSWLSVIHVTGMVNTRVQGAAALALSMDCLVLVFQTTLAAYATRLVKKNAVRVMEQVKLTNS